MQGYVPRTVTLALRERIRTNPAVVLLGPRQCGKTTLAKKVIGEHEESVYLDLEKPSHLRRVENPELFFSAHRGRLVCLDEIPRSPGLFEVLRGVIDEEDRDGQFLFLGSASPELIRQSSESLAGRISFLELTPFHIAEVGNSLSDVRGLWLKGGFPKAWLVPDLDQSMQWRKDFIRTFLERDIPQLGIRIPSQRLGRFWHMCAHLHGQTPNLSKLGDALGVSGHTIRSYLDVLTDTFVLRLLAPCQANVKKRLIKTPKIYLRDSGILHALLDIDDEGDLLGHPVVGVSWEGFVIEHVIAAMPRWRSSFYRTQVGAEIDLVMERGRKRIGIECKASMAPKISRGVQSAMEDLNLSHVYVIAPVTESYPIREHVTVVGLLAFLHTILPEIIES